MKLLESRAGRAAMLAVLVAAALCVASGQGALRLVGGLAIGLCTAASFKLVLMTDRRLAAHGLAQAALDHRVDSVADWTEAAATRLADRTGRLEQRITELDDDRAEGERRITELDDGIGLLRDTLARIEVGRDDDRAEGERQITELGDQLHEFTASLTERVPPDVEEVNLLLKSAGGALARLAELANRIEAIDDAVGRIEREIVLRDDSN